MLKSSFVRVSLFLSPALKQSLRCLSIESVQSRSTSDVPNASLFYFFPSPQTITPSFELFRFLGNTISRMMYYRVEPSYTDQKFINGSKEAIMLISKALKEGDNSIIRNLTLTACATKLYDRIKDFPEELIKKKFSFEKENIIHAYVHSSVISPNKAFNLELNQMTYFATVIAVIDPNSTKQVSLSTALNNIKDDTLFCNLTLCRQLYAEGLWKISDINFFDYKSHETNF